MNTRIPSPRPSILIVDDQNQISIYVKRVLQMKEPYKNVTAVASAKGAINACTREKPDLVISDLHMPKTDGMTLIRRLKKAYPVAGIIMSGDDSSVFQALKSREIDPYLEKPINEKNSYSRLPGCLRNYNSSIFIIPRNND